VGGRDIPSGGRGLAKELQAKKRLIWRACRRRCMRSPLLCGSNPSQVLNRALSVWISQIALLSGRDFPRNVASKQLASRPLVTRPPLWQDPGPQNGQPRQGGFVNSRPVPWQSLSPGRTRRDFAGAASRTGAFLCSPAHMDQMQVHACPMIPRRGNGFLCGTASHV
jgi:hypothetical protein